MKVVMVAFACRPGAGSEPGAGWTFARSAARAGHQVTLLTTRHNRAAIDAALATEPALRIEPVYLGVSTALHGRWDRVGRPGRRLYYLAWQFLVSRKVSALHRRAPFEMGHHVTLSADWMPSGLGWVDALPVVWGPIGGAERVPKECRKWLGWRGRLEEAARRVTADPMRRLLAGSSRHAALVVAQNPEAAAAVRSVRHPVLVRPNVFLDPPDTQAVTRPATATRTETRALFVGRLLGWKGVHLALAVMAHRDMDDWQLDLIGSGPEARRLSRNIEALGLGTRVRLMGQRSREEVRAAMSSATVLLYPSMRDAASWAVGEAQMAGCPVVCLKTGGPPVLLAAGGGVCVPPSGQIVDNLAAAVRTAATMPRTPVPSSTKDLPDLLDQWYSLARERSLARG